MGSAEVAAVPISDEEGVPPRVSPKGPCRAGSGSPRPVSCQPCGPEQVPAHLWPQFLSLSHGGYHSSAARGRSELLTAVAAEASEGPSHVPVPKRLCVC